MSNGHSLPELKKAHIRTQNQMNNLIKQYGNPLPQDIHKEYKTLQKKLKELENSIEEEESRYE